MDQQCQTSACRFCISQHVSHAPRGALQALALPVNPSHLDVSTNADCYLLKPLQVDDFVVPPNTSLRVHEPRYVCCEACQFPCLQYLCTVWEPGIP